MAGEQSRQSDRSLILKLSTPSLRIGLSSLGFDPITHALGMPLEQLLAPFLQSPKRLEARPDGGVQESYTLRLQSGQGTSLELPALGELGLYADSGMLRLLVPWALAPVVVRAVASLEPLGPYQVPSSRTGAPLADFWFHVRAGQRLVVPIPAFGEVLIEVG